MQWQRSKRSRSAARLHPSPCDGCDLRIFAMILKRMTIQSFGALEWLEYNFVEGLNVLGSRYTDEIARAIGLVLCHKYSSFPADRVRRNTVIEALVYVDEKEFRVIIKSGSSNLYLTAYDETDNDVTKEYRYLISHCLEQDTSDVFCGDGDKTLFKLLQYSDEDRYYASKELSRRTDRRSETNAFRAYLKAFIKNFQPERIREGKRYELYLKKDGKYAVRLRDDYDMPVFLSESEQTLFRYLCFLKTAEFWHGFEELRNLHAIKKPLLVKDFLSRLDESINIEGLLQRTAALERQVIILN